MPGLLTFAAAFAHGPPAAVIGVAAEEEGIPTHVALTEGLAVRDGEGWRYVCPASWGSAPLAPDAAGLTPAAVFVPGGDGLFVADLLGRVEPTGGEPAASALLGVGRDHERIVALAVGSTSGRALWDVAAGGDLLWTGSEPFTGVAPWRGELHLVGPREGQLHHLVLDPAGVEILREDLGPSSSTNPLLRGTDSALWLVERSTGVQQLASFPERVAVGSVVETVLGPVGIGDRTWVALDGGLHEVIDGSLSAGPDPRAVDCLASLGDGAWACAEGLLHALSPDGTFGPPIVGPTDVGPPDLELVAETDVALCFSQWRVWATDAGVDPGPVPGAGDGEPPPVVLAEDGCGCDSDGATVLGAWWAAWLFRRRRCRGPSLSSSPSSIALPPKASACSRRSRTRSIPRLATGTAATRTTFV